MQPKAWSPSALEDFVNCPFAYYEKSVLKKYPYVQTQEAKDGVWVHEQFEDRQSAKKPLPTELSDHEDFMTELERKAGNGVFYTEQKIAFDQRLKPCNYFAKDVWCRGVIDHQIIDGSTTEGLVTDYKTGKPHTKFRQLTLYALHTFAMFPSINTVTSQFYWTKTKTTTHQTYTRDQVGELWRGFVPDLNQFAEAFKTNTWQKRPSGLCKGWCQSTDCEHWSEKKKWR